MAPSTTLPARALQCRSAARLYRSILVCATLLAGASTAHAFSVEPLQLQLSPLGDGSRASMVVANNEANPVTIEVRPVRVAHDAAGAEVLTDAEDLLLVFPPVAIIEPGSAQTMQVQYIGDPELASSDTFRLLVQNVPVSLSGAQQSGVSLQISVQALLHVVPQGTRPVPRVVAVEDAADGRWHVSVANEGDRYARLADTRWTLESDGADPLVLDGDDIDERIGPNLVLPGTSRRFLFSPPDGLRAADTRIRIDLVE